MRRSPGCGRSVRRGVGAVGEKKRNADDTTNEQTPDLGLSPCERELNYHARVTDINGLAGVARMLLVGGASKGLEASMTKPAPEPMRGRLSKTSTPPSQLNPLHFRHHHALLSAIAADHVGKAF